MNPPIEKMLIDLLLRLVVKSNGIEPVSFASKNGQSSAESVHLGRRSSPVVLVTAFMKHSGEVEMPKRWVQDVARRVGELARISKIGCVQRDTRKTTNMKRMRNKLKMVLRFPCDEGLVRNASWTLRPSDYATKGGVGKWAEAGSTDGWSWSSSQSSWR